MSEPKVVLVTGATGNQGGAVARALLARGHRVLAMTRDQRSEAALRFYQSGARLVGPEPAAPGDTAACRLIEATKAYGSGDTFVRALDALPGAAAASAAADRGGWPAPRARSGEGSSAGG